MKNIIEITALQTDKVFDDPKTYYGNLFITKENGGFLSIDNSTGDAWTEFFHNRKIAEKWLLGEIDTETAYTLDSKTTITGWIETALLDVYDNLENIDDDRERDDLEKQIDFYLNQIIKTLKETP